MRRHGGPAPSSAAATPPSSTSTTSPGRPTAAPDNLLPLCGAHHRATHVGALVTRGSDSAGLTFEHADGVAYGSPAVSPARVPVLATVLELLERAGRGRGPGDGRRGRELEGVQNVVKGGDGGGQGGEQEDDT